MWGAAVSVWMSDRMMCNIWQGLGKNRVKLSEKMQMLRLAWCAGFPYFHAIWHLVSAFACYYAIVLCSYMNALAQAPYLMPVIRYFPEKFSIRPIPYVTLLNLNYWMSLFCWIWNIIEARPKCTIETILLNKMVMRVYLIKLINWCWPFKFYACVSLVNLYFSLV